MNKLTAKYKPYPAYGTSGIEWLDSVPGTYCVVFTPEISCRVVDKMY